MDITSAAADGDQIRATLQTLHDSVESIKDDRAAAVQQVITPVLREPDQKQRVTAALHSQGKSDLAKALERVDQGQPEGLSDVARVMVGRGLDQCSDIEIGRLSGDLQRLLDEALTPEPRVTLDPPAGTETQVLGRELAPIPPFDPVPPEPRQSTEDRFKHDLAALIDRYRTDLDAEHLATLLTSKIESLRSPAASETAET